MENNDSNDNGNKLDPNEEKLAYLQETIDPEICFNNTNIARRLNETYSSNLSSFSDIQKAELKELTFFHLPQSPESIQGKPHLEKKAELAQQIVAAKDRVDPTLFAYAQKSLEILASHAPVVEEAPKAPTKKEIKSRIQEGKLRAKKEASQTAQKLSELITNPDRLDEEQVAKTIVAAFFNLKLMNRPQRHSAKKLISMMLPQSKMAARRGSQNRIYSANGNLRKVASKVMETYGCPTQLFCKAQKSARVLDSITQ